MHITTEKKQHSYIPYIITAIIVSLLAVVRLTRPHQFKQVFFVDYKRAFEKTPTVEIADFTRSENWKGDYTLDTKRSFDGETGLNFFSSAGKVNMITLQRQADLSVAEMIHLFVYVPRKETLTNMAEFKLIFSSEDEGKFTAPVGLKTTGWNYITIPLTEFKKDGDKASWKNISSVSLYLTSNKDSTVQLSLDRIWGQKKTLPRKLDVDYDGHVSAKSVENNTFLHVATIEPKRLFLRDTDEGNRFIYTASFVPMKFVELCAIYNFDRAASSGYLFCIINNNTQSWRLLRQKGSSYTSVAEGVLSKNTLEKRAYSWIRIEKDGGTAIVSVSSNGTLFDVITTVKDPTFSAGSLGMSMKGSYLIDTVEVKK